MSHAASALLKLVCISSVRTSAAALFNALCYAAFRSLRRESSTTKVQLISAALLQISYTTAEAACAALRNRQSSPVTQEILQVEVSHAGPAVALLCCEADAPHNEINDALYSGSPQLCAHPHLCGQRRAFADVGRPVTETRRGSARRASVAAEPELEEDEELLDTIDVSPEEMAAFFEKPSYEPAAAGGKTLPGAAASMLDSDANEHEHANGYLLTDEHRYPVLHLHSMTCACEAQFVHVCVNTGLCLCGTVAV
eukprot:13321-Heterococcus_DN1.PRE.2